MSKVKVHFGQVTIRLFFDINDSSLELQSLKNDAFSLLNIFLDKVNCRKSLKGV